MFEHVFLGNTLQEWGTSLLIILITVALTKLVQTVNQNVIQTFTKRTRTHLDDIAYHAIESPLLFGIMLIGIWIAIHRLVYPDRFVTAVDSAYKILIVLNVTWVFARLINSLIEFYWTRRHGESNLNRMVPVIKRTLLVVVWIIGIVMALSNVGVNIGALLGTLGIGGIAFALAAQDTIKNLFGAVTIFTDKPFSIGDTVRIDGYEGTIVDVGARSTKMMDYDKRIITFPNYKVTDTSIINISSEPMRRVVMNIRLTYGTTPDQMKQALQLLNQIPSHVKFVSKEGLTTYYSELSDTALILVFIYFIEKEGDILKVTSDVNIEVFALFTQAGLQFALPTQTILMEKKETPGSESTREPLEPSKK